MLDPKRVFRLSSGVGSFVLARALLGAATVHAQAAPPPQPAGTSEEQSDSADAEDPASITDKSDLDPAFEREIIVTASTGTNISGVKPVGSEAVVMDRNAILQTGKNSVADVVRTLPQMQNLGFDEAATGANANASGNSNRGTTLNLRGIGSNATLILVDGHRVAPSGAANSFTDAVQVPVSALERVEVVADGASAIYGSDAISGVVNYVLRKKFDGIELGGRYNFNKYYDEFALSAVGGLAWDFDGREGSVMVAYEHSERGYVARGKIPYLRQDLRRYGGADFRIVGNVASPGSPGNIVVPSGAFGQPGATNPAFPEAGGYIYYAIPSGTTGVPSVDSLIADSANLVDRSDYEDFLPKSRRNQVVVYLNQELTEDLEFYNQTFYNKRQLWTRTFLPNNTSSSSFDVTIQPGTPYYIEGIPGVAAGSSYTVQYNLAAHMANGPAFINYNPEETISTTTGLRAKLFSDWEGEVYYTYGQNKTCGVCYLGNFVNGDSDSAFNAAVNQGLINPYSDAQLTQDQLDLILGTNYQYSQNYFHDVVAKVNGALFDLPGGTVKMALGGEYTFTINKLQNGASRGPDNILDASNDANSRRTRTQYAAFGELYVPVISPDMHVPLMDEFLVNAAIRYDDYSDFGGTVNPKIGATWTINNDLALRGSWGTSFRAPGLPELEPGLFSVAVQVPVYPNNSGRDDIALIAGLPYSNILIRLGGNPELKAEKGTTWSLGADFTPSYVPGLKISGTYYRIEYKDQILGVPWASFLTSPETASVYSDYIVPISNGASCVNGNSSTYDPALVPFLENFLYGSASITNPCGISVVLDGRYQNVATAVQTGIDFQADYMIPTDLGTFLLGGSFTKILKNEQQLAPGLPTFDALDRINYPVSFRARGNLGYLNGPFSATLYMNHVGGYLNDQPITIQNVVQPNSQVPSWTTFDLSIGFAFDDDARWDFMRGVRFSTTVQNLFDADPPIVLSGQSAIDMRNANPYGPIVQFSLTKAFH
ncbi:TonB-dependent receptor [Novosphingobium profundi]|uniref:TonB-dependent receptor plug domain-containing protein n=1 Tax=Novosphingobium profundi TaxID=1774954 RepID=UPI001BDB02B9|nr:TonB-dependent receptor [Novosphingobium profundi]MBT0668181.1 TonB-dependent receptor [Novosphingobium profundi]